MNNQFYGIAFIAGGIGILALRYAAWKRGRKERDLFTSLGAIVVGLMVLGFGVLMLMVPAHA